MPTDYFVDSTTGNDGDNGTTMDLAWATIEHAVEAGGLVAGDYVWVRRIHVEYAGNPTSDIAFAYRGTPKLPIRVVGWPRNTHAVVSSDWTNGSTTVVVDDADMDREKHCGRYITAPDGHDYLITKITDASHIMIDREYVGATIPNQAVTIKADEDYALAQAIDDSAWVIKKADYNADADDLPCIDFKDTAFKFYCAADYSWEFKNLELRDANTGYGMIRWDSGRPWSMIGCLFHQDNNRPFLQLNKTSLLLKRCILEGNGAGSTVFGISLAYASTLRLVDCAIYNLGGSGFQLLGSNLILENVNIGVEAANVLRAFIFSSMNMANVSGRDVKIVGDVAVYYVCSIACVSFENYQKILGAYKVFDSQGEVTKVLADGAGVKPNQRAGGAENVVEILYNAIGANDRLLEPITDWALPVFVHEFDVDTTQKTYRYYVQSMANLTADQLWIELEYVAAYDDETEYVITKVLSDEAVAVRANQNDWSQYIEVPNITPAVASRIKITCKCSYLHATNKIFVDPGDFSYLPTSLCAVAGQFIPRIRLHGA